MGIISLGYLLSFKTRTFGWGYIVIATYMFGLIVFTIFNDYVGKYYGIARVYFTALPLLAPFFIIPFQVVFKKYIKLSYILPFCLIAFHALTVSGVLHMMFGVRK